MCRPARQLAVRAAPREAAFIDYLPGAGNRPQVPTEACLRSHTYSTWLPIFQASSLPDVLLVNRVASRVYESLT